MVVAERPRDSAIRVNILGAVAEKATNTRAFADGRCWARTSDLLLVRQRRRKRLLTTLDYNPC